jgi:CheY-like chemotaxis protein
MSQSREVLVVEDDLATRTLLETILRRSAAKTTMASDGAAAITLLEARSFDLVILDLMMPHVGGFDVIDYLKTAPRRPPVIVCTAAGPAMTRDLPTDIVSAVMRKPFDIVELMEKVNAFAGRPSAPIDLPHVLIVDDDSDARFVIRAMAGPADVIEAEGGEEALTLVRNSRPDVIFLDLQMPGMSGEELLAQLRDEPATASIPVVIVTSKKLTEPEREHLLRYCSAFIYKGDLSRERLSDVLRVVLRRE